MDSAPDSHAEGSPPEGLRPSGVAFRPSTTLGATPETDNVHTQQTLDQAFESLIIGHNSHSLLELGNDSSGDVGGGSSDQGTVTGRNSDEGFGHSDEEDAELERDLLGRKQVLVEGNSDAVYCINIHPSSTNVRFRGDYQSGIVEDFRTYLRDHVCETNVTNNSGDVVPIEELKPHQLATLQARLWLETPMSKATLLAQPLQLDDDDRATVDAVIARIVQLLLQSPHVFLLWDKQGPSCNNPLCDKIHTKKGDNESCNQLISLQPMLDMTDLMQASGLELLEDKIFVFQHANDRYAEFGLDDHPILLASKMWICIECLNFLWNQRFNFWATGRDAIRSLWNEQRKLNSSPLAGSEVQLHKEPRKWSKYSFRAPAPLDTLFLDGECEMEAPVLSTSEITRPSVNQSFTSCNNASTGVPPSKSAPQRRKSHRIRTYDHALNNTATPSLPNAPPEMSAYEFEYPPGAPEAAVDKAFKGTFDSPTKGPPSGYRASEPLKDTKTVIEYKGLTFPFPETMDLGIVEPLKPRKRYKLKRNAAEGELSRNIVASKAEKLVAGLGISSTQQANLPNESTYKTAPETLESMGASPLFQWINSTIAAHENTNSPFKVARGAKNTCYKADRANKQSPPELALKTDLSGFMVVHKLRSTSPRTLGSFPRFPTNVKTEAIYCICYKPDDGSVMVQCGDPECVVGWYHYKCLSNAEKTASKADDWICEYCRINKDSGLKLPQEPQIDGYKSMALKEHVWDWLALPGSVAAVSDPYNLVTTPPEGLAQVRDQLGDDDYVDMEGFEEDFEGEYYDDDDYEVYDGENDWGESEE